MGSIVGPHTAQSRPLRNIGATLGSGRSLFNGLADQPTPWRGINGSVLDALTTPERARATGCISQIKGEHLEPATVNPRPWEYAKGRKLRRCADHARLNCIFGSAATAPRGGRADGIATRVGPVHRSVGQEREDVTVPT